MIPLSDTETWRSLGTAYGDGEPVALSLLQARELVGDPEFDNLLLKDIWGHVCHQGTPYPALFATIPHLVELAETLDPGTRERANILAALGYALVNARISIKSVGDIGDLDPERYDCRESLRQAAVLIANTLLYDQDDRNVTAHLFATLAAIKGEPKLYFEMWGLYDNIDRGPDEDVPKA